MIIVLGSFACLSGNMDWPLEGLFDCGTILTGLGDFLPLTGGDGVDFVTAGLGLLTGLIDIGQP